MQQAPNTLRGKYFRRSRSALALLLAASPFSGSVQAVTIDFETAPVGFSALPFSEGGFTIYGSGGWTVNKLGVGVSTLEAPDGTVRLKRTDNGPFDLSSLDVIDRASVGTFGLTTSVGGSRDLSAAGHYTFSGADFEGLSWVDMKIVPPPGNGVGSYTTIDNIVVNNSGNTDDTDNTPSVPDTGSTGLLLSGVLGTLGLCQRRLRRA